jgi:hypothetical protein
MTLNFFFYGFLFIVGKHTEPRRFCSPGYEASAAATTMPNVHEQNQAPRQT